MVYAQESVLKKEMQKILWDFEIQTDHLVPAGRPELEIVNMKKRNYWIVDFAAPVDHSKNQRKQKKRQIVRSWQRTKKAMEHEGVGDTNCNWCT